MYDASRRSEIVTEYARTLIRVKAKQLVRRPGFCRSDQEDIEQDLLVHLLTQAEHFDPDRSSLNTFIDRVVNTAAAMLVRERHRSSRRPPEGIEVESLTVLVEQPDGLPAPLGSLISKEDLQRRMGTTSLSDEEYFEMAEAIASVIESLPPEERRICRALLTRNHTETKQELELSRRKFDAVMDFIRERFREEGFGKI